MFLLLFIAGPLRRFGAYTIPDFAEGRFDSPVFRKIAVVFVLFIGFFYTMPQMKGAGTTLAYIFPGLPYWAGVVLVGAVITLNVALGGMKGITLVQAFQYWVKMFAISVPIFVLMAVYGHYGKQVGVNGDIEISNYPARIVFDGTNYSVPLNERRAIQKANQAIQKELESNSITNAIAAEVVETIVVANRKPLPPKAPADTTWLNPFGPLTTKAAKTAAAAIGKKAETEFPREGAKGAKANELPPSPFGNVAPSGEAIPLRAGLSPEQRMTVNLDSLTVAQAFGVYAELTGRQLLPNTNSLAQRADDLLGGKLSQLKLVKRTSGPDSGVREHGDGAFTAAEVKTAIEERLHASGWVVQAVGASSLRAAPVNRAPEVSNTDQGQPGSYSAQTSASGGATSADRGKAAEKAWLAKHEKPLALLYTYSLIIAHRLRHGRIAAHSRALLHEPRRRRRQAHHHVGDDSHRRVLRLPAGVRRDRGATSCRNFTAAWARKGTDKIVLELPRILNEKYRAARLHPQRHHLRGRVRGVHEHLQRIARLHDRRAGP